jgi:hypothetical protein
MIAELKADPRAHARQLRADAKLVRDTPETRAYTTYRLEAVRDRLVAELADLRVYGGGLIPGQVAELEVRIVEVNRRIKRRVRMETVSERRRLALAEAQEKRLREKYPALTDDHKLLTCGDCGFRLLLAPGQEPGDGLPPPPAGWRAERVRGHDDSYHPHSVAVCPRCFERGA